MSTSLTTHLAGRMGRAAAAAIILAAAAAAAARAEVAPDAPPPKAAQAAVAAQPKAPPLSPKTFDLLDLPPASDESIEALGQFITDYMTYGQGFYVSPEPDIPGIADDMKHVLAFRTIGQEGTIVVALRPTRSGWLLLARCTREEDKLLHVFRGLLAALDGRIQALKAGMARELLSRARVVSYNLGYISSDRALAALRMMGCNVVDVVEGKAPATPTPVLKSFTIDAITDYRLPLVSRVIDSENTSLTEQKAKGGPMGLTSVPDLGGASLSAVTDSSAQQRLLIAYDPADPDSLRRLQKDIAEVIDLPAQQILIEGMILEVGEDKLRELGMDFLWSRQHASISYTGSTVDAPKPLTAKVSETPIPNPRLEATLRAMVSQGTANVLAKPSILALNNYQARIRIGREIPISTTVATTATTNLNISYFFTGIVLNLKPRISRDGEEVSMQIEAMVSSKAPVKSLTNLVRDQEVEVAPVVDSRVVQTYARVSNNTPFIIGGLISHDIRERVTGVPLLMDIPLLGNLFKTTKRESQKNEVIVVLTPRVVPQESRNYFAVMPKDSDSFDSFGSRLFRNTYRIRGEDLFDLAFVYEEPRYVELAALVDRKVKQQPALEEDPLVQTILQRKIPGETPLMIRMLYELVKSQLYRDGQPAAPEIPDENIIAIQPQFDETRAQEDTKVKRLKTELDSIAGDEGLALVLQFDLGNAEQNRLMPPLGIHVVEAPERGDYNEWMRVFNRINDDGTFAAAAIVIRSRADLRRLKTCLVLKKLIEINNLPDTLHVRDFPVGMQILFPNLEDVAEHMHVIDAKVAKLFYLSDFYYQAFQKVYNAELEKLQQRLNAE